MPTLRIHFTSDDLARTRLTPNIDVRWETALSLNLLQVSQASGALRSWRAWARRRLGSWAGPLLAAAPPAEHFPDFLELLRRPENAGLAMLLDRYHAEVIAPAWSALSTAVAADRARRTRSLLEHGLEGLLSTLTPTLHWRDSTLEAEHAVERDLHLAGRGLVLVPSYFCSDRPLILTRPGRATVLVHPIAPDTRILFRSGPLRERRPQGLDALMGSTRAAVLHALADGCTTTELAQRVGVSAATASQHATVLRDAGLISTQRKGPAVLHIVTALGSAVLSPT